jgi:hypothetical protein
MRMTNRRSLLAALALAPLAARAHHGWSSFDEGAPIFLAGTLKSVRWTNPHAEGVLAVAAGLALPADLAKRTVPPQSANVDGAAVLARATVPAQAAGDWTLEFAPLSRMQAWGLAEAPAVGARIEAVGYTGPKLGRLMRVEYLFIDGRAYALRSSPR